MDSNSLKNSKIIIDYNIKESKNSQPILNNRTKNKINKIKCLYFDSNELTKDETCNKLEKKKQLQKKKKKSIKTKTNYYY